MKLYALLVGVHELYALFLLPHMSYALLMGGRNALRHYAPPVEVLYAIEGFYSFGGVKVMLKVFCLIWEDSRAHEVSHVDWTTYVGALFVSGLGLNPSTINRAPPPSFLLANLQES